MSDRQVACSLEGEQWAGTTEEAACTAFRRALADEAALAGVSDELRIALSAASPDQARAIVSEAEGTVIADLEFAVMDTALSAATWEQFARDVAREVARKRAG